MLKNHKIGTDLSSNHRGALPFTFGNQGIKKSVANTPLQAYIDFRFDDVDVYLG